MHTTYLYAIVYIEKVVFWSVLKGKYMPQAAPQQGGGGSGQQEGAMGLVWVIVGIFILL